MLSAFPSPSHSNQQCRQLTTISPPHALSKGRCLETSSHEHACQRLQHYTPACAVQVALTKEAEALSRAAKLLLNMLRAFARCLMQQPYKNGYHLSAHHHPGHVQGCSVQWPTLLRPQAICHFILAGRLILKAATLRAHVHYPAFSTYSRSSFLYCRW